MKRIDLTVIYKKHFWIVQNTIPSYCLKIKINHRWKVPHILKTVLKWNNFLIFKFVNNTCKIWACFYMIIKPTFVPGKILIAIVTLSFNGMGNLVASIFLRVIRSVSKMDVICKKTLYMPFIIYWFLNYVNRFMISFFFTYQLSF